MGLEMLHERVLHVQTLIERTRLYALAHSFVIYTRHGLGVMGAGSMYVNVLVAEHVRRKNIARLNVCQSPLMLDHGLQRQLSGTVVFVPLMSDLGQPLYT